GLISSRNATASGAKKRGSSSSVGFRKVISSGMAPMVPSPRSDRGQLLGIGLRRSEQVTALRDALDDRADRPAVGTQLGIVELVPGDGCRDRRATGGPNGVGRDQGLDWLVLRVVEPGATLAGS